MPQQGEDGQGAHGEQVDPTTSDTSTRNMERQKRSPPCRNISHILQNLPSHPTAGLNASSPCGHLWNKAT